MLRGGTGDERIYVGLDEPYDPVDDFARTPLPDPGSDPDSFVFGSAGDGLRGGVTAAPRALLTAQVTDGTAAFSPIVIFGIETGSGADRIVFEAGWGDDEVYGFTAGVDTLDFSLINGLDLIDLDISDTADGALIAYGSNSVLIHDVFQSSLTDADFLV